MLTDASLSALLCARESTRVERKESYQSEDVKKTVCAFANDISDSRESGIVFIGIRDDGSCADMSITDALLLRVGEIRADGNLLPAPAIEIEERVLDGCRVLVLQVRPHSAPPVRFKGRAFIRVGPRNQQASPEEERILNERRRGRDLPFDYRPINDAVLSDIDEFRFRERYLRAAIDPNVIAENGRSDPERMMSLRLLDPNGIPTFGGLLIVGKDPERFIPGAYIQYNRFENSDLSSPILDTKRISGTLDEQLSALEDVLKLNIKSEIKISADGMELRTSDYPFAALQQLARNAVMHRNYESNAPIRVYWFSDRVEIHNAGGLYGQVNAANFGTGVTDYRNPLVSEGMRNYGYVQKFGIGIQLARKALIDNGNPEPEFQFSELSTAVVVRREREV